jgi:predicted amidohydrolase
MKIGYCQFSPSFCDPDENIQQVELLLNDAEFDLLVLPELSNSGYLFSSFTDLEKTAEEIPSGKFTDFLAGLSRKKKCHIVSGICEKSKGKFFNTAVLITPDSGIFSYRKIHLFYEETRWFEAGTDGYHVHEITLNSGEKIKIGMMICFDWIFPEAARTLALKGAQIICHPSNLVLPYCQKAMFARAVENHLYIITANRTGTETRKEFSLTFTGGSVIIDPKGNYISEAPSDGEYLSIKEIDPSKSLDKFVNQYNNVIADRKPDLYELG